MTAGTNSCAPTVNIASRTNKLALRACCMFAMLMLGTQARHDFGQLDVLPCYQTWAVRFILFRPLVEEGTSLICVLLCGRLQGNETAMLGRQSFVTLVFVVEP